MIWRELIITCLSTIVVSTLLAPKGSAGLNMRRPLGFTDSASLDFTKISSLQHSGRCPGLVALADVVMSDAVPEGIMDPLQPALKQQPQFRHATEV